MAQKTYYYGFGCENIPLLERLVGAVVVGAETANDRAVVRVAIDETAKDDLDATMASLGWTYLGEEPPTVTVTNAASPFNVGSQTNTVFADVSSGPVTVVLPPAAQGKIVRVKRSGGGTQNKVTVTALPGDTISDGDIVLSEEGQATELVGDGGTVHNLVGMSVAETPLWTGSRLPTRVATTTNIADLAAGAPNIVDGVALQVGDRVLVADAQTDAAERGPYVVVDVGGGADGQWVRGADFDSVTEDQLTAGITYYVQEGDQNGVTRYTLTTPGVIVLGVTALSFRQEVVPVRTDAAPFEIKAAGAFTNGSVVWSDLVDARDYSEVSVWVNLTNIGTNTSVRVYAQWPHPGGALNDGNGTQQTDALLGPSADGAFLLKEYKPTLEAADNELVTGNRILLTFPKKGTQFRLGVMGNAADGSFSVDALRLA